MPPNSGVMTQFEVNPNSEIIALLCIGEVADQDNVAFSPLSLLYGKPVIHHFIKALQGVGVSRFCIGIDTVPGALLSYRDSVAAEGLNIEFVREPAALSALLDANSRVLVIRADTLWNTSLVKSMLSRGGPFIAAVEERAENQIFERIDLNNRWSGLAVLERRTLDALPQMPEGWDMASALLRQAVQDGVPLLPVKQSELQSGNVRKLTNIEDASSAVMSLHSGNIDQTNTLEDKLLSYPVSQFLPLLWSVGWGRIVAEWMFPVFALGALSLAIADFVTAATIAAIVAILSAFVRSAARSAD